VLLFLPAWNEEDAVAGVIARAPEVVGGRRVTCLVVDDGSSDATVARAVAAGAEVIVLGHHVGLGAAVRRGLAEGVRRRAAAIAFCDADGEYAPEELARLVRPVLDGTADYVVGSRFAGSPRRMAPHRWLGNRMLTAALGVLVGRHVSDGQSGYRALSPSAAASAQIAHDFNYAQVLTLDLLAKGFRYHEVPISYRFRTTGRSFVRPVRYLREVVPTVLRLRFAPSPSARTGVRSAGSADAGSVLPRARGPAAIRR
jgi:glycosyltransferase involved in cell wall biosynthesis